jgi:hypothetical protein
MPLSGIEKIFFIADFGGVTNMKIRNDIFYSLNVEDIQTVAVEEIDRELTDDEIEKIIDSIAEKISWYDAIAESINEVIVENNK